MTKTTNKYSPEVRERSVRMVLDNQGQHESRWAAILSISSKIGCAPQTLNEWVKKVEVDTGQRGGIKTCLLYTSPSPRDRTRSRMPSSA